MRPGFFIVGAPKCGTTSLYGHLAQHPEIFMPSVKEPTYFGSDLYLPHRERMTREEYLSLFGDARPGQLAGEASTAYLSSACAATEIKRFAEDAKIIVMLRDPVEMMHSFHSQRVYQGTETTEDFCVAMAAEEARRPPTGHAAGPRLPEVLVYRDVARFSGQIARFFDVFGRDRVLVILLDDLRRDPQSVYRDVLAFLGVSSGFTPVFEVANGYKETRSPVLHRLLMNPPPFIARSVSAVVAPRLRHFIQGHARRLNTRPGTRPPIDAELGRSLREEFSAEVRALGHLLGRDLSAWSAR